MKFDEKVMVRTQIASIVGAIGNWFATAAFIMWGWNVIAPYLNAPTFTYWEIFGMRMAVGSILAMFKKKIE